MITIGRGVSKSEAKQNLRSSVQGFTKYPTLRSYRIKRTCPKFVPVERKVMVQVNVMTLALTDILKLRFGVKLSKSIPNVRMLRRIFVGRVLCKGAQMEEHSRFAVGDPVIGVCIESHSDVINVPTDHLAALCEQDQPMPYSMHRINVMATQACHDKISLFANLRCPVEANNDDNMSKHDILNSSITCISVTPSRITQCLSGLGTGMSHLQRGAKPTTSIGMMVMNRTGSIGRCFKAVVITGGLGALGALLALQLVSINGGAGAVALTNRSGRASDSLSLPSLKLSAAIIICISADSACTESVTHSACQALSILTGSPSFALVQAAGALMDSVLSAQNVSGVRRVCSPKVDSLMRFLKASRVSISPSGPIILFSSIASMLGSAGQANYAAANASLDAIAGVLRYKGNSSLSVQWGAWTGGGMAKNHVLNRTKRLGIGVVRPIDGKHAFHDILTDEYNCNLPSPVYAFSPIRWNQFLKYLPLPIAPMFDLVAADDTKSTVWSRQISSNLGTDNFTRETFHSQSRGKVETESMPSERHSIKPDDPQLQAISIHILNIVRELSSVDISPNQPLMESGIDSLAGMELKGRLEATYHVEIPATAVFDYPSVAALSAYIYANFDTTGATLDSNHIDTSGAQLYQQSFGEEVRPQTAAESNAVYVFGWAGSISFEANRLFQIDGCQGGRSDSIRLIDADRWESNDSKYRDPSECGTIAATIAGLFGSWVPVVHNFDAALFGILAHEGKFMDPQQRLLLEAVQSILGNETSMFHSSRVNATRDISDCMVAVGICSVDYAHIVARSTFGSPSPYIGTGNAKSACCGRLSYSFGFQGSSIAIDTACSSSLVAGHITRKEVSEPGHASERGLVSGAALILSPHTTAIFAAAQMLAVDSRCKTLDIKADGYVRTEAVLSVAVKSEPFHGVHSGSNAGIYTFTKLHSSASNQDGRSSSLTAPNGPSQKAVIVAAVQGARPPIQNPIRKLELHGTGTALGDPIEFGAAVSVLHSRAVHGEKRSTEGVILLHVTDASIEFSSVKSCCGHSEATAGILGMMSVIANLYRHNGGWTQHLCDVNPFITQILLRTDQSFPAATTKRQESSSPSDSRIHVPIDKACGVSSFAFQGTNAHGILSSGRGLIIKTAWNSSALLHKSIYWCFPCLPAKLHASVSMPRHQSSSLYVDIFLISRMHIHDVHVPKGRHAHSMSTLVHLASHGSWMLWEECSNCPERSICKDILLPAVSLQGALRIEVHMMQGSIIISEIRHGKNGYHMLLCNMANFISKESETGPPNQHFANSSDGVRVPMRALLLRCAASIHAQIDTGIASQIVDGDHRLVTVTAALMPRSDACINLSDWIGCHLKTNIYGSVSITIISQKWILYQGCTRTVNMIAQKRRAKDRLSVLSIITSCGRITMMMTREVMSWAALCLSLIEWLSIVVYQGDSKVIQKPKASELMSTNRDLAFMNQDLVKFKFEINMFCANASKHELKADIKPVSAANHLGFLHISDLIDCVSKMSRLASHLQVFAKRLGDSKRTVDSQECNC